MRIYYNVSLFVWERWEDVLLSEFYVKDLRKTLNDFIVFIHKTDNMKNIIEKFMETDRYQDIDDGKSSIDDAIQIHIDKIIDYDDWDYPEPLQDLGIKHFYGDFGIDGININNLKIFDNDGGEDEYDVDYIINYDMKKYVVNKINKIINLKELMQIKNILEA